MSTPPDRAPRRDSTENRAAILDAARRLLRGDADASLEAIAAEAGLTRRAVYGHFASRDELVHEVITLGAARISAGLAEATHEDSRIRIAEIAAGLWAMVAEIRIGAQFAVRGPYRAEVARLLEPLRARLHATVQGGIDRGELRRDLDAATLAHLLEGAALAVLDEATTTSMPADDARRLVMLATLGMAGLSWTEAGRLIDTSPTLAETGMAS